MNLNPISPKVIVGVVVGLIFTSLASNVTALDPHVFDFLGPWGLFVFGVLLTFIKALAEYFKTDPLRVVPPTDSKPATSETPASSPGSPAIATGSGSVAQSDAVIPAPATPTPPSA